ncbi:Plasmid stabilization system protein [Planctomycetes bacterium CA13]|uniref:Plasmid stabilization system protein n=1 Tax=Novipirellula herctigrandis TaxID=2527986 RepID=A0A5C5Z2X4_9BACT|nr:Plasmid stabilization system protein [Planctomycetes bacterium CA13]
MGKVRYSKLASSDLYENSEFIARDKPEAAYRWVEKIEAACQTLAVNPETGQRRISKNHGACRSFSCGNYVIFFRGLGDEVEIIRIVRGERDLDNI